MAEKEYTCEDCCEFINLNTYCPVEGEFIDDRHKKPCAIFRPKSPPTVFDHITESVEALAEEFVDAMYDRVVCEYRYYSMLTAEFYDNRAEALIATIEELKKEWKG